MYQRPASARKYPQSPGVCRYFLAGTCAYGNKCQKSHKPHADARTGKDLGTGSDLERGGSSMKGSEKALGNGSGDADINLQWGDSGNSQSKEELPDVIGGTKAPCIFFPYGDCQKGDDCDFSHGNKTSREGHGIVPQGSVAKHAVSNKDCKQYMQGNCRAGSKCQFKHVESSTKSTRKSPSIAAIASSESFQPEPSFEDNNYPENGFTSGGPDEDDDYIAEDTLDQEEIPTSGIEEDITDGLVYANAQLKNEALKEPHVEPSYSKAGPSDEPQDNLDFRSSDHANNYGENQEGYADTGLDYIDNSRESEVPPNPVIHNQTHASRKGPSSYYGEGWEERAPLPLPVPMTSQPWTHQHIQPVPKLYPHISEVIPHWSQFADPHAKQDTPFCKQHAQGQCIQGDACRFRHSVTIEEYTLLFHDQQPNLWTLERNPDAQPSHQSLFTPTGLAMSQAESVHPQTHIASFGKPKVSVFAQECKFYSLNKCRNGDKCPYEHIEPPAGLDQAYNSSNQEVGGSDSGKICPSFAQNSHCAIPDCKDRHEDPGGDLSVRSGPQSPGPSGRHASSGAEDDTRWTTSWSNTNNANREQPSKKFSTPCRYYKEGKCNKDDCQFKHDEEETEVQAAEGDSWGPAAGASGWVASNDKDSGVVDDSMGWGAANDSSAWTNSADIHTSRHGEGNYSSSRPLNYGVCYDFKKGRCNRTYCKYSHVMEGGDSSITTVKGDEGGEPWPPADGPSHSAPWAVTPTDEDANTMEDLQTQVIQDAEASWSKPWPNEPIEAPTPPKKFKAPCMRYGQGYCELGDDCQYMHIDPDSETSGSKGAVDSEIPDIKPADHPHESESLDDKDNESAAPNSSTQFYEEDASPEVAPEPIVFEHPYVERFVANCSVRFAADATPDQVTTVAESKKLILNNLPVDVSPADITALAGPYGEIVQIISLDETAYAARIEVEFAENSQAMNAYTHLQGYTFNSCVISARLKSRIAMSIRSPTQTQVVKVSWPNPMVFAWVHYSSVKNAKNAATRLDGVIVAGRPIKVAFFPPPKRQTSQFAIEIRGLPVGISKPEIEELCPGNSVITLNPPSYTEDPIDAVRSLLSSFGEVEDFDVVANPASRWTAVAFATFQTEAMALEAAESLNSKDQDFLGNQPLTVRSSYYFRYRITRPQLEVLKDELDRLDEKCSKKCTIQIQDHHVKDLVWVRIHASLENFATFASINAELETLLQGLILTSDEGEILWDDYFKTPSSAKAIQKLNTTDTDAPPFYIHCDNRKKCIRVFGPKASQERGAKNLARTLQRVHASLHEIAVPRLKLRGLVNGAFVTLQDELIASKVSLDVASAKLIVRGLSEELSKAKSFMDATMLPAHPATTTALCQICLHDPIDPVLLSCRHAYCKTCLRFALRHAGAAPFQCIAEAPTKDFPHKRCPMNVPYVIFHDLLPPIEEKNFLQVSLHAYVQSRPEELFFCPTLDCQAVYRVASEGMNLKCSLCASEVCSHCCSRAHVGLKCKDRTIPTTAKE
ncbi:hypothetical protein B0H34DRAFT_796891 [Crassisporium funariophilum]|nr:hypothetical protein B0H34DRAFT_796891 [Crassisporium funariophilum]